MADNEFPINSENSQNNKPKAEAPSQKEPLANGEQNLLAFLSSYTGAGADKEPQKPEASHVKGEETSKANPEATANTSSSLFNDIFGALEKQPEVKENADNLFTSESESGTSPDDESAPDEAFDDVNADEALSAEEESDAVFTEKEPLHAEEPEDISLSFDNRETDDSLEIEEFTVDPSLSLFVDEALTDAPEDAEEELAHPSEPLLEEIFAGDTSQNESVLQKSETPEESVSFEEDFEEIIPRKRFRSAESKLDKPKNNTNAKKAVVLTGIVLLSVLALLLVVAFVAVIILGDKWGNTNFEEADTSTRDLQQLMAIFKYDLDADVSAFDEEDVLEARSQAVMNAIHDLPNLDYSPIVDALKADIKANLETYGFTHYQEQVVRWAVTLNHENRLLEIPHHSTTDETIDIPDHGLTDAPDTDTTPPETQPPQITTPNGFEEEPKPILGQKITDNDIYNILLLGSDEQNLTGRSDSIIIVSINKKSKRIILSSIQRDTIIHDPETGGYAKINDFYARYGSTTGRKVGRLINAISHYKNFGIKIDNYAVVDFEAFKEVISIFGNVEVPLYYSEYLELRRQFPSGKDAFPNLEDKFEDKKEGYIIASLNSTQTLAYSRMRKNLYNPVLKDYQRSSDQFRTERQRYVIHDIIRKMRHMNMNQLEAITEEVFPLLTTDLTLEDVLLKLATYSDFKKYSVDQLNMSNVSKSWYPCTTDGVKLYFEGTDGYGIGFQGIGILEAPYSNRDGYRLIREAWRNIVYK